MKQLQDHREPRQWSVTAASAGHLWWTRTLLLCLFVASAMALGQVTEWQNAVRSEVAHKNLERATAIN